MSKNKMTPSPKGKSKPASSARRKAFPEKAKKPLSKKPTLADFKERVTDAAVSAAPKAPLAKKSVANRRENSSGIVLTAALIVAVLAINVLIYAIVTVSGAYFPLVKEKDLTLISDATDALFDDAKAEGKKVKITFFYSFSIDTDVKNHSTGSWVYRSVQNFKEKHPDFIEVDYVNLVTRESYLEAQKGEGNSRISLEKYQNTDTPLTRYSVAFECGNNVRIVTDLVSQSAYGDFFTLDESLNPTSYDGEQYIAGMICNVTRDELLTAYIVTGHSETIDPALGRILDLSGYEYDMDGFDIGKASGEDWNKLKKECDLLIISNPKNDFSSDLVTSEIERLRDYVRSGGNLMVMLDPLAKKKLTTLESFLSEYGITVSRTTLETDGRQVCDVIREDGVIGAGGAAVGSTDGYTFQATYVGDGIGGAISSTVKDKTGASVVVSTAGALNLSGNAQPVLVSSRTSHCEVDGITTREGGNFVIAAISKNPAELGNSGESTIFVMSGIYSTSSTFLTSNGFANRDFYYSVLENAFGADHLPYGIKMALISDIPIIEGLTMGMAKFYFALTLVVPLALTVTGIVIVIKRKHR